MQHPQQTTRGAECSAGAPSRSLRLTHLPAYLAAGAGVAGLATSTEAAIVNIDITKLGLSGNVDVSGPNGGVSSSPLSIYDWLGPNTGQLKLYNSVTDMGLVGGSSAGGNDLQFAASSLFANVSPLNFLGTDD